jgi:hypothetical protein
MRQLPLVRLAPAEFVTLASLQRRRQQEDRLLCDLIESPADERLVEMVMYHWPRVMSRTRPLWQIL